MKRALWFVVATAPLTMAPLCESKPLPDDGGAGSGGGGGAVAEAPSGGAAACHRRICPGRAAPYACGDCIDNDGDGRSDFGHDPDCFGPCDNNEEGLEPLLPGAGTMDCEVDCYFDGNADAGNCRYSLQCDPLEPRAIDHTMVCDSCEFVGEENLDQLEVRDGMTCTEILAALDDPANGPSCMETCGPTTPPGCDCFGCCELPARSGNYVYLGTRDESGAGTCSYEAGVAEFEATGGDPDAAIDRACRLCTPVTSCLRPCTDFDLCFAEPPGQLACEPPGGAPPGSNPGSDGGVAPRPDAGVDPDPDPDPDPPAGPDGGVQSGPKPTPGHCASQELRCTRTSECDGPAICYLGCCLEIVPI
jgi:hypothetical protein